MARSRSSARSAYDEQPPIDVSVTVGSAQSAARSATVVPCTFTVTPQIAAPEGARSHVCLVFDCSTSMRGDKIQSAIEAAHLFVDHLHVRHRLSLVTFSSASRLLFDNEAPTESARPKLKRQIEALRSDVGGKTRLTLGIRRAMRTFKLRSGDAYAKTMIILSDGGADNPSEAFKAARQAADAGTQIFAVGVGEAYRADQLLTLVKPAAGAVLDYRESHGINAAFQAILGRIESFVATNARLELRLESGVRPGQAYRTSPETAALGAPQAPKGKLALNLGHLEPAKHYGLLFDLKTRKRDPDHLATALFTCDIPSLGLRGYCRQLDVCADPHATHVSRRSAQIADAAEALARATRAGDVRDALQRLAAAGAAAKSEAVQARSRELLAQLEAQGELDHASLNLALVAASHAADTGVGDEPHLNPGTKLYDVVLMDPGETPIRVVREIRSFTGRSLAEIGTLIRAEQPVIRQAVRHRDARDLQRRIKAAGAKAVLRLTPE